MKRISLFLMMLIALGLFSVSFGAALHTQAQAGTDVATQAGTAAATTSATMAATMDQIPFTLFNVNTATDAELLTIPQMNARMVREYFEYRPYTSILRFRQEIGKYVGADQVTAWEKYVYIPILVDTTDSVTLKQIPGVTDQIGKDLIAARPYKTNEAFLAKLATSLTPAQVNFAINYLDGKEALLTPTPAATGAATMSATATATP